MRSSVMSQANNPELGEEDNPRPVSWIFNAMFSAAVTLPCPTAPVALPEERR